MRPSPTIPSCIALLLSLLVARVSRRSAGVSPAVATPSRPRIQFQEDYKLFCPLPQNCEPRPQVAPQLLEDVGFDCAPGLAGNDERSFRNIDLMLECLDLRGIGGIKKVRNRKVSDPAKSTGPQRSASLPQALHLAARLPVGRRRLNLRCQRVWQRSLQSAHRSFLSSYPFCCVLFATAASSLSKASANNFTPSLVNLSVTSFIEMPARARSCITFDAPATSSVRLFRSRP